MFNLAIVGLGAWGKRLVGSVQGKSESVRFVAAAARTPAKIADYAAERNIRVSGDAAERFEDADGVVIASRYEPGIQRTYEEWSQHYSTTILPARPRSGRTPRSSNSNESRSRS